MGKDFYCRCGICDKDFTSSGEWATHAQTPEHKNNILAWEVMQGVARYKGEHCDIRGFVKQIQAKKKAKEKKAKTEREIPSGADGFIKTIDDAYTLIECYEYGSIPERDYLKACAWALKYFEKKYGKDSFWFRELFAHMQGDDWENSFRARSLVHAETIGVPHKSIAECDKHKFDWQVEILKGKKCQHCSYIEGIKDSWKAKTGAV